MDNWLNPPEPEPVVTNTEPATSYVAETPPVETTTESTTATGSANALVDPNCESGGDYTTDTGNGYYGAYQFDQSTWDAYAPDGYAGTNPAQAPPSVQDAAAAAVDYDAWPNC